MSLQITETDGFVALSRFGTAYAVTLNHSEQREVLEALARVHGFSLVDSIERRELIEKVEEVRALKSKGYASVAHASLEFQQAGEALAEAVAGALDLVPEIPEV